jgi:hypothetical protein
MKPPRRRKCLFFYEDRGHCRSFARDTMPGSRVLIVGRREIQSWWALVLNDGVYCCVRLPLWTDPTNWTGQLPDNWIDLHGNLRGRDGNIIFNSQPIIT